MVCFLRASFVGALLILCLPSFSYAKTRYHSQIDLTIDLTTDPRLPPLLVYAGGTLVGTLPGSFRISLRPTTPGLFPADFGKWIWIGAQSLADLPLYTFYIGSTEIENREVTVTSTSLTPVASSLPPTVVEIEPNAQETVQLEEVGSLSFELNLPSAPYASFSSAYPIPPTLDAKGDWPPFEISVNRAGDGTIQHPTLAIALAVDPDSAYAIQHAASPIQPASVRTPGIEEEWEVDSRPPGATIVTDDRPGEDLRTRSKFPRDVARDSFLTVKKAGYIQTVCLLWSCGAGCTMDRSDEPNVKIFCELQPRKQ